MRGVRRVGPRVPYHRKPESITLDAWQKALRKQFAGDKEFCITRLNGHLVFADYNVFNPETKNVYKVALRDNKEGMADSMNFCACMDFRTNRLGTCKHLEAVLGHVRANPDLTDMLQRGYNPPYTSVYLQYGAQREVKVRIGTEDAEDFRKLTEQYFYGDVLIPNAYSQFEYFLAQARAINEEFRCYGDALEYVLAVREHQRRNAAINDRYPDETELNNLLKIPFFPYQRQGVLFAAKAGRCLIADEMGLGKTVQAIGAAELLRREQSVRNVLVICPTSLKYQWKSEIHRFTDSTVKVIEGAVHIRARQYQGDEQYKIVSYHTASRDVEEINVAEYDLIILDEAQRIKNWKTKLAQGTKKIKSAYAIVLTGTPLENKLEDLYSIMQVIDPFKLGPYYGFLNHHQITNEMGKVTGYRNLREISEKLSDIMVRRLKKDVFSQLPERMDKILFVPMTEEQLKMYNASYDMVAKLVSKWNRFGFLNEIDRQRLMMALSCMRMVCDSTYIIDQNYENRHDTKIEELMNILDEIFESSDEKVVVFSQWKRMTHLVAKELDIRGVPYEHLHGGVSSEKRKDLFDRFNNDPDSRVFLSTDAGSTGLNLQSASTIINLDIPWSPAVLEQRIARVHRIGQKNKVQVINFVAQGTIEHRMLSVLSFKDALAHGVLDHGEDAIFMNTDKFTKFMKTVESVTGADTDDAQTEAVMSVEEAMEPVEMGTLFPHDVEGSKTGVEANGLPEIPQEGADEDVDTEPDIQIDGDDDIAPEDSITSVYSATPASYPEPQNLLTGGLRFLGDLAQTLSSSEATERLVSSIVERDETTGRSYMKIPVDDRQTVVNVMNMLGQLFKGFGK